MVHVFEIEYFIRTPFRYFALSRMQETQEEISLLMKGIIARDSKSLRELYMRFSKVIYNSIYAIVRGKEDAEEILGEVFFQVWEKSSSYDQAKGSVYTWILTLARNRSIDRIRSRGYRASKAADINANLDEMSNENSHNQLDQAIFSERAELVKSALQKISPEQRKVLEVAYFEGRTQIETAENLGLPLGTVKSRVRDGMKAMQSHLNKLL